MPCFHCNDVNAVVFEFCPFVLVHTYISKSSRPSCSRHPVSLTKSLAGDLLSLTVLTRSDAVIYLLKNCEKLLQCKS